mmetsp:Transcript_11203/g.29943  ORF Transcript_11203/g.29943 Transcript_11203/m.29943 type:complete len:270 (-) Transcript_11203:433-1242(-)
MIASSRSGRWFASPTSRRRHRAAAQATPCLTRSLAGIHATCMCRLAASSAAMRACRARSRATPEQIWGTPTFSGLRLSARAVAASVWVCPSRSSSRSSRPTPSQASPPQATPCRGQRPVAAPQAPRSRGADAGVAQGRCWWRSSPSFARSPCRVALSTCRTTWKGIGGRRLTTSSSTNSSSLVNRPAQRFSTRAARTCQQLCSVRATAIARPGAPPCRARSASVSATVIGRIPSAAQGGSLRSAPSCGPSLEVSSAPICSTWAILAGPS